MCDIIDQMDYEDFTQDLKLVSDCVGLENTRKLIRELQGVSIYIPRLSKFESFITKYILRNKDQGIKSLARELRVSESFVRKYMF